MRPKAAFRLQSSPPVFAPVLNGLKVLAFFLLTVHLPSLVLPSLHLTGLGATTVWADDSTNDSTGQPPSKETKVDFRRQVAPILARRCLSCHDQQHKKGDFQIQSAATVSDSGFVEAGDPESSHLLDVIEAQDGKAARMPKDSDPLKPNEVALIRAWIQQGAAWPEGFLLEPAQVRDMNWWSLKPLADPQPPLLPAEGKTWRRSPIDAFVYQRLQQHGLSPSAEADRRILVRRLYYDLIGLPPTPQQVREFLSDKDPRAYENLVEQLLKSPHYGERWARHWLDVVHYADTHGYDKDKLRPNAWPYRDYVIRSFNNDKPYSRFVREQLAGDALWPDDADSLIATGFIAAGPWDFIGHAEVPETKFDGRVARNLDRDNMVTSTMNTFCSLTVQCARCHHHKLDPVTMEDYYSLQAVFAALDRADRPYDADPKVAQARHRLKALEARQTADVERLRKLVEGRLTPQIKQIDARLAALAKQADASNSSRAAATKRSNAYGYHSQVARKQNDAKWVQVDLGADVEIDQILLFGADEYGFSDFGFPHRFQVEVSQTADFTDAKLVADHRQRDFPRPGDSAVSLPVSEARGRYVRVTATKLWSRRRRGQPPSKDWIFALGELAVFSNGKHLRPQAVSALDSIEAAPRWAKANLIDSVYGALHLEQRLGDSTKSPSNGFHSAFSKSQDATKWVQLDFGKAIELDQLEITPAFPTDWADTPGFGFPLRWRIEASDNTEFSKGQTQLLLDRQERDFANPGLQRVVVDLPPGKRRYLRLTATKLWDRGAGKYALAFAELRPLLQGRVLNAPAKISASDSIESGRWSKAFLQDGFTSRLPSEPRLANFQALIKPAVDSSKRLAEQRMLQQQRAALFDKAVDKKLQNELAEAEGALKQTQTSIRNLPKPSVVYAGIVHEGAGAFRGRAGLGPREIRVLHRGDLKHPGKVIGPGATPFVPNVPARFDLPAEAPESHRRVALADWITHHENPLFWRSIVNRIWLYHFGRGLVDTPNDFGRGGDQPTHPLLLDWLARHFRDNGQSIKDLHRLIVNSAVYRQASTGDQRKSERDADNQFYWRMNRRRLTAEEVRDAILVVSGKLKTGGGGPGFMDFVIEHPQHSPHYEYHKYDPNDETTHRRAIYRFIVRSQPQPFMDTLDCADPSMSVPKRSETLTSLQALALLNNRFVVSMSENFSRRLQSEGVDKGAGEGAGDVESRIRRAIQLALAREAEADEVRLLSALAKEHGLANVCRLIFNLNEFVFVD